jgi:uncharacterized membrane protein YeaQ/YmgE (transglycosylase-associated protein family)
MLIGLIYALLAGLVARSVFRVPRPPFALALAAGVAGTVVGAPIAHRISGEHEFHAFQPESFIAGIIGAFVVLSIVRLVARRVSSSDDRLFS